MMKRTAVFHRGGPCSGCPIFPHIPDNQFRFPSCELCHWPAVGVGAAHAWRCAACRHWNEHGHLRPRVAAVLLRLADLDPAARRLPVVDPRYGVYLAARPGCQPCPPRARRSRVVTLRRRRRNGAARGPRPRGSTGPGRRRSVPHDRAGRPVFARATVAGLPVLIVGGDRPYPYPLGLAEDDREPCAFGSRATRIGCPCDQPPPCLHGQALYAHVVTLAEPAGRAAPVLTRSAG
jgi:hypothetical protein